MEIVDKKLHIVLKKNDYKVNDLKWIKEFMDKSDKDIFTITVQEDADMEDHSE